MSATELRAVWRSADATVERDVLAFWRERHLLPDTADAGARLRDLCVVASAGARVVGALEARVRMIDFLRARIAMIRMAAPADKGISHMASRILPARMLLLAQKVLEAWSRGHPEEKVMGIGAFIPPKSYGQKLHQPIWKEASPPLVLVNYTPRGDQFRLAWFPHARVE